MRCLVTTNGRFQVTPDGTAWTLGNVAYDFWTRYLDVYDSVVLLSRGQRVEEPTTGARQVSGPGVSLAALPDYHDARDARAVAATRRQLRGLCDPASALHMRLPCLVSPLLLGTRALARPYGVELVGDPREALRVVLGGRTGRIYSELGGRLVRRLVRRSVGAAYVTPELAGRYPPPEGTQPFVFSSVMLSDDEFAREPAVMAPEDEVRLLFVGSLAQEYKGLDVLLAALGRLPQTVRLRVAGGGTLLGHYREVSAACGLHDRVEFLGHLADRAVLRDEVDRCHLYVVPSLTEGLPRSLLEAMARGVPCIGSAVGGLPSVLPPEALFPPGDPAALAAAVTRYAFDAGALQDLATTLHQRARAFSNEAIRPRRAEFYRSIRDAHQRWLREQNGSR